MRRIIIFIIILIIAVSFSGCTFHPFDNNFPARYKSRLKETSENATTIIQENPFGKSLQSEANLLAYTIDKNYSFCVEILYKHGDRATSVPVVENTTLRLMDHYKYRELYCAELIIAFNQTIKKYNLPSDGEVIGAIINWRKPSDSPTNYHSICDIDGDARWDYLSNMSGCFGDSSKLSAEEKVNISEYESVGFLTDGGYQTIEYDEKLTFKNLDSMLS